MKKLFIFLIVFLVIGVIVSSYYFYVSNRVEYVEVDLYGYDSIPRDSLFILDPLLTPWRYNEGLKPKDGIVPNAETAAKIAEAIWVSIFGDKIYEQRPYHVTLYKDSIWIVNGNVPAGWYGENAHIEIAKKDGRLSKIVMGV